MKIQDIELGIANYADKVVIPKIPNMIERWGASLAVLAFKGKGESLLMTYEPMLVAAGLYSDGEIDIDKVESLILANFEKIPKLPIGPFTFTKPDVSEFIRYVRGTAPTI